MQNYNSDGDFVGPGGIVVPGMYHGEDGKVDRSTWQQLIPVSDEMRQKMFDNVKREFIQENGISNGDTIKRSKIFREIPFCDVCGGQGGKSEVGAGTAL